MAELLKSKRVFFPSNKQQEFLLQSQRHLHCTWKHLALLSKISTHHLINWRNEKNSMSLFAVKQICKHRNIEVPKCIVIKDAYWYVTESARAGGKAVIEKYGIVGGDQEHRKKKWQEWWEKEGKFKPSDILKPLPFRKPVFSKNLAEFAGIMLGDGGMSKHQFTVTLNSITDKKYSKFVHRLIKNLFEIPVGVYFNKKFLAKRIVVSRTAIISYLIGTVGLQPGNKVKQQVDIPFWIKENQQHSIACLRGLIDTD
ncbi:MAG TPA: hypothetical protein VJH89_01210, partial [Patescibacteria group bacterium]|nr:hypothetical protein [Patescibacteria group bacterium]